MKIKKCLVVLLVSIFASLSGAEIVSDVKSWKIENGVQIDTSKLGPGGNPSFKVDPKGRAMLKLRDTDGSGKVSFYVYDDGLVSSPNKARAIGPRWGTVESSGRNFVGAILYASYLQAEGSLCLIDTDPKESNIWSTVKFLSPRGKAGWKKWEFNFDPNAGLLLTVDGKAISRKNFDWNTSKAAAFNGIVLLGDDTPGDTAQTIWISDITYELGPLMNVKPGDLPPPPPPPLPVTKGPAPEEETEKSTDAVVWGKMDGYVPGATLLDDVKNLKIPLVKGYASQSPRLLFSASDRSELEKRMKERPDLWNAVLANAGMVVSPEGVPTPEVIRSGKFYWRIEKVQSGALAWFITGDKAYRDGAVRWMLAHCKENTWGDSYRPNLDLVASWYLYHISVAYDILKNELTAEERKVIRTGLVEHARYLYLEHDPLDIGAKFSWDQNHTYIPTVALSAVALALLDEEPEAKYWLTRSYALLRRSRAVLNEDGYYYESIGYWFYALGWHVRGAELLGRATGENLFNLPALRDNWLYGLHMSLPGTPRAFNVGDSLSWKEGKFIDMPFNGTAMLWAIASKTGSGESRTIGDMYGARALDKDYPATAFLWFDSKVKPVTLDQMKPYHYFADQDVITWRSGWDEDATCYFFRCGPTLGHKAAKKLETFTDWGMNPGHVHPDIGAFLMYAKGTYLAIDTDYSTDKFTKDHNTLLVDGKGQGMDGSYWNFKSRPYSDFDGARIMSQFLSPDYAYARGSFGSAYTRFAPGAELYRSLLMTKRWVLAVDDIEADRPRKLTWLCHSISEFKKEKEAFLSRQPKATLAVVPLSPASVDVKLEPTIVKGGITPGRGVDEQRGYKIALESKDASKKMRFITLLFALGSDEKVPEVEPVKDENNVITLQINWPGGKIETARLDLDWQSGADTGPASFR